MSVDVIARPSPAGLAHRREQIERDRLALLAQMEQEELMEISPPARGHRIGPDTPSRLVPERR